MDTCQYYGETAALKAHWPSLKQWIDGQLRVANTTQGQSLPSFWTWGDWCPVGPRSIVTPATGAEAAAANFLLALSSAVKVADALGETTDAALYRQIHTALLPQYQQQHWNATLGTWANNALELQTLSSVSLATGVGSTADRSRAVARLVEDVEARGDHLTVGSVGQKWLLRTLSEEGHHDTALKLALQTSEPSWGYWISQGATTCWESWSGKADLSHPPTPTHNHIFLCGGVGEWMYEYLGGIRPVTNGYEQVTITPAISKSAGPSAVNMSVTTVRGLITSQWTRYQTGTSNETVGSRLVLLKVRIPIGVVRTLVHLPLLGLYHTQIRATLNANTLIWDKGVAARLDQARGVVSCVQAVGSQGDPILALELLPGTYEMLVIRA
jgi:alpha-L-rhamnosidase